MVACNRCAHKQLECRLSSLSKRCSECVRTGKKCGPAAPKVDFSSIDRAMEKLEKEELETEAAWKAANELARSAQETARTKQSKLERLRVQKRFLRKKEQNMFDKGLDDVEELERLEDMEKAAEVERSVASASSLSEYFDPNFLSAEAQNWLAGSPLEVPDNQPSS